MLAAGIALGASVLTSFLNNRYQDRRATRDADTAERAAEVAHIEVQLSKLYGPLKLLTGQSKMLSDELRKEKPPGWHLLGGLTAVVANPADRALTEQILMVNERVEQLLLTHAGLLVDGQVPASHTEFLAHFRYLTIAFAAAREHKELPDDIKAKDFATYPAQFDTDVNAAYQQLVTRRQTLANTG